MLEKIDTNTPTKLKITIINILEFTSCYYSAKPWNVDFFNGVKESMTFEIEIRHPSFFTASVIADESERTASVPVERVRKLNFVWIFRVSKCEGKKGSGGEMGG